jgi:hypothetical protein
MFNWGHHITAKRGNAVSGASNSSIARLVENIVAHKEAVLKFDVTEL